MTNPWEITLNAVSITSVAQISSDEWCVTAIIRRKDFDGKISIDSFSNVINIRHAGADKAPYGVSLDGLCYTRVVRECTTADDHALSHAILRKCYHVTFRGNDLHQLASLDIPVPTEVALGRRMGIWPEARV